MRPFVLGLAVLAGALVLGLICWGMRWRKRRLPRASGAGVGGPSRPGLPLGPLARAVFEVTQWGPARGVEVAERVRLSWPAYADLPTIAVYPVLRQLERLNLIRSVRVLSSAEGVWHRYYSPWDASTSHTALLMETPMA